MHYDIEQSIKTQKPLVSLIIPCYNVAERCQRMFSSLIRQTYTNIQLILVNDGSTDNTEEVLLSYKAELEALGYQFEYISQSNRGAAAAVNAGLKRVKGDLLCWCDADDYFSDNSFCMRVEYMLSHPECAIVSSDAIIQDEDFSAEPVLISSGYPATNDRWQFEHCLRDETIICCGCHMVSMDAFRKVNPEMDIYESRYGQNLQMLLPIYAKYERHFLSIPLYTYIVYADSHSHYGDYKAELVRVDQYVDIVEKTLSRMPSLTEVEQKRCLKIVRQRKALEGFIISMRNDDVRNAGIYLRRLKMRNLSAQDNRKIIRAFIAYIARRYRRLSK